MAPWASVWSLDAPPRRSGRTTKGKQFGKRAQSHMFARYTGMTAEEIYAFFYGSVVAAPRDASSGLGEAFMRSLTRGAVDRTVQMIGGMHRTSP